VAAEILNQPTAPVPALTAAAIDRHNALPTHAFWTTHSQVDPTTGASFEYAQQSPTALDKTWLHTAYAAIHPADTGKTEEYTKLRHSSAGTEWVAAATDEIGRLAQGNLPHMLKGTHTIYFIPVSATPQGRKATYLKIVAANKPHKCRVRFTVGGDRVDYKDNVSTKAADLTTAKCLFNSVISTPGAKFMTTDIKDFYLNTPMNRYEYMRIPEKDIPAAIMTQYNLAPLLHNGAVYVEIRKGMYGLPQAGRIANDQLLTFLAQDGYHQAPNTPGLFTHTTRPVTFSLVVDNFGVKYVSREHAEHLVATLQKLYAITPD
jgi:hypothetical protein